MAVAENIKEMTEAFYRATPIERVAKRTPLVVGFGHRARMGKDTAVAHLVNKYADGDLVVKRYAFADELKREFIAALKQITGDEEIYFNSRHIAAIRELEMWAKVPQDHEMEVDPLCPAGKPRYLLQWWGGELRRSGKIPGAPFALPDENYWVRKVQAQIASYSPHVALISDVRYPNEAAICDVMINIKREGFSLSGAAAIHPSETSLDNYPYNQVISVEEGDVSGLLQQAENTLDSVLFERRILIR